MSANGRATPHYIIIGNGAAGVAAAEVIRQRDETGRITIVTDEPFPLYSRPGIAYLILDRIDERQIFSRSREFYRQNRLDLLFAKVIAIEPISRQIILGTGKQLAYDVLLVATGAGATNASFPGNDLDGIVKFDTLADARQIKQLGKRARHAVVIGGGITAMELCEGFRHLKTRTHFLQRRDRVWPRLFNEEESAIVARQIAHEGIQIHYNEEVAEAVGRRGKIERVRLKSGRELKCQLLGVAIGVRPNLELVKSLPVEVDHGILVDEYMGSSCADIFAAGDVAQVYDRWTGAHHLDILWPSAISEGRLAGFNMVEVARGRNQLRRYIKGSPFNAALLFGLHLTVIGRVSSLHADEDTTVGHLSRGASHVWTAPFTSHSRSAWDRKGPNSIRIIIREDRIVGALLIGNQELADILRKLIEEEINIEPIREQLLDRERSLSDLLRAISRQRKKALMPVGTIHEPDLPSSGGGFFGGL